jgi:uncharacterized membrane protein
MDGIDYLALVSRWIHLLSVVTVVGGSIFMRYVLAPAGHAVLPEDIHQNLRTQLLARWKKFVHIGVALLLISGGYNFYITLRDGVEPMPYHAIFSVKFLLAMGVFFVAIALTSTSPGFASLHKNRHKWMSILVMLAVTVILLSSVLKMIHQVSLAAPAN